MGYIGVQPEAGFTSGLLDRFTSTTGTTVTLTHDISSENDIIVFVNFVKQDSTNYSVGGTGNKTLTLGGTLVSSDVVEVHYLNIVKQTSQPSANSVGITQLNVSDGSNGQALTTNGSGTLSFGTVGGDNTPAFFTKVGSNQTIADGTWTKINFDTEEWDTDSAYDSSSNYRFTVPSGEGGKYFYSYSMFISGLDEGEYCQSRLYLNGSSINEGFARSYSQNNIEITVGRAPVIDLSAGDYLEVYAQQTAGSSETVSASNFSTWTMYKLIGV